MTNGLFFKLEWSAVDETMLWLSVMALLLAPLLEFAALLLLCADIRHTPFYRKPSVWAGLTAAAVLLPVGGAVLFWLFEQIPASLSLMTAGGAITLTAYIVHGISHRRQGVAFGRGMWTGMTLNAIALLLCIVSWIKAG